MQLERSVINSKALQVGNVEKVIGEITNHKYDTEKTSDETIVDTEVYRSLLEEKLPKIINNISLLGKDIHKIGSAWWFHDGFNEHEPGNELYIRRFGKESVSMWVQASGDDHYTDYQVEFVFKKNPDSLKRISMYTLSNKLWEWWADVRWSGGGGKYCAQEKKRNHPSLIRAGTAYEFSDRYINMILNQLERKGESPFLNLPSLLSQVPNVIAELYKSEGENLGRVLTGIQSHNKKLEDLDVSDFK
jgi:hypothetical protein